MAILHLHAGHVLSLSAPVGSGKTRFLTETAKDLSADGCGVYFVSLEHSQFDLDREFAGTHVKALALPQGAGLRDILIPVPPDIDTLVIDSLDLLPTDEGRAELAEIAQRSKWVIITAQQVRRF